MHILVVGAGPIGLEAALQAAAAGHTVTLVESGRSVGAGVGSWGHVRLFSPWRLNISSAGLAALAAVDAPAPDMDEHPTGEDLVSEYLEPIAEYLADRVEFVFETDVVAIGRGRVFKTEHVADGVRAGLPFRVLTEGPEGEAVIVADAVLDCSGVLDLPNFVGLGGIPAIGEAEFDGRITRRIPDFAGSDGAEFAGKTVLVVGSGMSAASTLDGLVELIAEAPKTRALWVGPQSEQPYARIAADSLPERDRLAALGNAAAAGELAIVPVLGAGVAEIEQVGDRLRVTLELKSGRQRTEVVDEIVANTGYRPNNAIFEELHVHQCYASQAPMKLAASLPASAGASADCLTQAAPGPDLMKNPEPRFFVLGSKSYGRNSSFLLKIGFDQVSAVMGILEG